MHKMLLLTSVFLLAAGNWAASQENVWTPLGDGSYPPPIGNWPNLTGSALCWMADRDVAAVAPIMTEREGREGPGLRKLSFDEPQWSFVPGKTPESVLPDMHDSPKGYLYLPGLKKLLFLKQEWWYSRKREAIAGWLLDPAEMVWEPLRSTLSMSDRSAEFNPAAGKDGLRLPIWGAMAYDAHNKEALAFGGGGVWGRVGREIEAVGPRDWIFDETLKRVRRLTPDDRGTITQARKWYPGHCGTWLFSEAEQQWRALEQPLGQQPSARILPAMAYDAAEKKIVLFGGDDLARCLDDTWIYDCVKRSWSKVEPPIAPRARAAHAMVYVPDQKVILMAGGYAGGWNPLKDVWAFSTVKGEWRRLAIDLPEPAGHASADYDARRGLVLMAAYPGTRGNRRIPVLTLKLNLATVPAAEPEPAGDPKLAYHCRAGRRVTHLPGEWLAGEGAPEDETQVRAGFKALPANQWKHLKPPRTVRERNWGSYIYDTKTHRAFAWGGGHSAYAGAEISEFHLLINRWREMEDPTNYNPIWLHGMVGGPPGVSFGGWSLLPTHARKSYGVDPLSDSVITYVGDVYSIKHHMFVGNIGQCPGRYGVSTQVAFVTTPHGLYGYSENLLARANVKDGKWDEVAKGGPPKHNEHCFLAYDAKRNRLVYFYTDARVWVFDFATAAWSEEAPAGKTPPVAYGDATYIPDLDAVLMVFAEAKEGPEKLYFYNCGEKKWYRAPSEGDPFAGVHAGPRDWSPHWDQELGLVVRISPTGFAAWLNVHVMRLDPASLKLSPVE